MFAVDIVLWRRRSLCSLYAARAIHISHCPIWWSVRAYSSLLPTEDVQATIHYLPLWKVMS